jgi:hypothetical protein
MFTRARLICAGLLATATTAVLATSLLMHVGRTLRGYAPWRVAPWLRDGGD